LIFLRTTTTHDIRAGNELSYSRFWGKIAFLCLLLASFFISFPASSQTPPERPEPLRSPAPVIPEESEAPTGQLSIKAFFTGETRPISSGVSWRIFREIDTATTIVARSDDASPTFKLETGAYLVHAAYGYASATRRVNIKTGATTSEKVTLSAGALKLSASISDNLISPDRVSFSVFVPIGSNSEGRLVLSGARTGDLIRLPEGSYHVVSNYGDTNSIMRSDIKVENAKVTEATLNHRAANITVKLVTAAGAEALAGTIFSILTPGGDVVREAIGAFPQMVLAEGSYVLIARHSKEVYTRDFKVQSGVDREVEVIAQ
jgi:hypothetical protein